VLKYVHKLFDGVAGEASTALKYRENVGWPARPGPNYEELKR